MIKEPWAHECIDTEKSYGAWPDDMHSLLGPWYFPAVGHGLKEEIKNLNNSS